MLQRGNADHCPRGLQATDDITVWFWIVVRSIHFLSGAWGSACGQNTGFQLHSPGAGCRLRLDIREVGVLSVTMQVPQHSAGPVLSAMREKLTQKKKDCGEEVWDREYGVKKIACDFFFLWRKRVARKEAWETTQKSHKNETRFSQRAWLCSN